MAYAETGSSAKRHLSDVLQELQHAAEMLSSSMGPAGKLPLSFTMSSVYVDRTANAYGANAVHTLTTAIFKAVQPRVIGTY